MIFLTGAFTGCRAFRRLFHKKKPAEKTEQKIKTPESVPAPKEAPSSEAPMPPAPGVVPPPSGALMPPGMGPAESGPAAAVPGEKTAGVPGAESAPMTGNPPSAVAPGLPEVGGAITVSAGSPKKVAEGSYFLIEDAQAASATGKTLSFQWSVVQGPADKIQIVQGGELKGSFKVLNVNDPTSFVLRLTASDGSAQASSDVNVTVYPVKLELKNHLGGITRQVDRIWENTYVSRGRTLEIYDPQFNLIAKTDLEDPIQEMVGFSLRDKNYLYVLTESGEWLLLDVTDPKAVGKSLVQKSGAFFKNLKVWIVGNDAWATAVDKDMGVLWNLNDLTNPQVRLQLKGSYKGLRKMILWGKNLYLVDRGSLYTLDATTGVLTASIPAGGAVTGLDVVDLGDKSLLVMSLGEGEEGQKSEGGLRVFQMGVGGKLINERRYHLKGNPSVERLHAVPYTSKLLLAVKQKDDRSVRVFDAATESEIPLDVPTDLKFAALLDLATGRLNNVPMAVVADASALRVLKFNPVGTPLKSYKVESVKTSYSTLAAGAVKMAPGGASLFLLDFGSMTNALVPALFEISANDLSTKGTLVLGDGSYLTDFSLTDSPKMNFAANVNDDVSSSVSPESQKAPGTDSQPAPTARPASIRGPGEGALRVFSTEAKPFKSILTSRIYGEQNQGNESRPFGMDVWTGGTNRIVVTAVGRVSGTGARSGLVLLRFTTDVDPAVFFKGDLAPKLTYIPLIDARDVKISRNGKWALVAAGGDGLAVVDLEKNQVVLKNNPKPGAVADRVLLSNDQKRVFVSYLSSSGLPDAEGEGGGTGVPSLMEIFYFDEGKLGVWGELKGLSSVSLPYSVRTGAAALSADDLYLFVANGRQGLWVFNASDPSSPVLIAKLPTYGIAVGVAVGEKYKNLYIADLINGLEMAEFGF